MTTKATGTKGAPNGGAPDVSQDPKPDKPQAATEELDPQPKKLKWAGVELELPAELPREILFDATEMEAESDNAMPMYRLLRSLVGREQFLLVRNHVAQEPEKADEAKLLEDALALYGVTLGESEASEGS